MKDQRILRDRFLFRSSQSDRYGAFKPSELMICMQEMAGHHGELLGLGREELLQHHAIWVLIRNEFQLFATPKVGEAVLAETFPGQPRRTLFPRYHRFTREDGSLLAIGVGGWTMADTRSHRMCAIPELLARIPDTSDLAPLMAYPGAVQPLAGQAKQMERLIAFSDFDFNQHVNNTRCGDWLLDMLDESLLKTHFVSRFLANYDREVLLSGPVSLSLWQQGNRFSLRCERDGQRLLDCGGELSLRA